jgi:hypothetical protein
MLWNGSAFARPGNTPSKAAMANQHKRKGNSFRNSGRGCFFKICTFDGNNLLGCALSLFYPLNIGRVAHPFASVFSTIDLPTSEIIPLGQFILRLICFASSFDFHF